MSNLIIANATLRGVVIFLAETKKDNSTEGSLRRSSCQYHCLQTEPGLDKFVGNASRVRASLEPLILWAERLVPPERHGDTPVFVLATAGLRRLVVEDARLVLDDVEAVVKEHSFLYKKSWIRVLSGKEEAYYGWVALNYKMGSLTNSSRTSTLGLLDLGGSSLQVVMEDDAIGDDKHLIRSEIGLIEHRILAFSLPAFGLNEAFDRTVAILNSLKPPREGTRDRIEIRHPCLRSDFVQNYTCYGCVQQNITNKKNSSSQMQRTNSASVYLVGDPNWEQCRGLARAVAINSSNLDWSHPTVGTNCKAGLSSSSSINILNLTAITHPTGHFHALSGFFVVYNKLNLISRANLTKVWEKGEQLCPRSWADLSYNAGNRNHAVQHCFQVPYMASLIEEALCLGEAEIIFGPGDLSWTLGAALIEGRYLWQRTTKAQTSFSILKHTEVLSSPIFLFLFLLILLSVVYCSQIQLPMPGKKGPKVGVSLPSYIHPKHRPN
ncbi:probable apyrase 7 [Pistacia vera]|uniref:probable apyrase 7 n=1 Tax=Pistacia vera TaxID=55513 RepID=UPI0012633FC3|nr:probable apyrase 7 [Pistacia vera]